MATQKKVKNPYEAFLLENYDVTEDTTMENEEEGEVSMEENKKRKSSLNSKTLIEKAIKKGLNKSQIKALLKSVKEHHDSVDMGEISTVLNPLLSYLEDTNDFSAYSVIEAMLLDRDVQKFKEASARWLLREEKGHL